MPACRPLLIGFTVPDEVAEALFALDALPAVQTHKFGWSLARSLQHAFGSVHLLSAAPVQSFPLVPRLWFRRQAFRSAGFEGIAIGFINLPLLKHVSRLLACILLLPVLLRRWRIDIVFIHGVHTPYLLFGVILRCMGVRVVPVLTDPAGVVLPTDGAISHMLKRLDRFLAAALLRRMTAIIALAPKLVEPFARDMPTLTFPGIVSDAWMRTLGDVTRPPRNGRALVIYAGGLNVIYGVDRLIDAARAMPDVEFRLFGAGDLVRRIESEKLTNLVYGGFLSADDLAPQLLSASLLINPRPSGSDIARQSFPSKLLEYLATARPVLTTRIASVPPELASSFHYIEDEASSGVVDAIERVMALPAQTRAELALRGRERAVALFSERATGERIRSFLDAAA